ERVITNSPQSALLGKAQLNKGWALWADGKKAQSQAAFKLATEELPHSAEQAVGRLKLADTQFFQRDYTNALLNFRRVLEDYSDVPRVKDVLAEQALYQIARVSLETGDVTGENEA